MLRSLMTRLGSDRSGQALIVLTLASPAVMGGAGMAVDYSMWVRQKASLQTIADAAALAAAFELSQNGLSGALTEKAEAAAVAFVEANGNGRDVSVMVDMARLSARVSVSEPAIVNFGKLFGIESFDIRASSTAAMGETPARACILATNTSAKTGVKISGSGTFLAEDCTVWSNADSATSIVFGGSITASATRFCYNAGGYSINGVSATVSGGIAECGYMADPLEGYKPTDALAANRGCDFNNIRINSKESVVLQPGRYCGGLAVTSDQKITLNKGFFIVDGGPMKLTAGSNIVGEEVGVWLEGKQATLEVSGQADVLLTADADPASAMPGIVLATDPDQTGSNLVSRLSGGASVDLRGSVHFARHDFVWTGNSSSGSPTEVTMLIARTVEVSGTADVLYKANFEEEGFEPIEIKPKVAFIAQ